MRLSTRSLPWAVAIVVMTVFLVTGLRHLDAVPRVYEDEPWQASTAYKLATSGVLGSDLFAGFHNMNQRYYGFMPLHPLLLAGVFEVLGVGLAQARLETVLLGLATLVLTFTLALRLFNVWTGAIAVALLVLVRWTGLTYLQPTGIPLVDFARIARYDPLVPVVGLGAVHAYVSARQRPPGWPYLAAGFLAGMAGLAHLYGLFWVPTLVLLSAWDRRPRALPWIIVGAVLPWLPYAAYVLTDLPDWRGQTAIYANRFELLNPSWYIQNIAQEYHRYGPGLGPVSVAWLARPGFWLALVALPVSLIALSQRAFRACDTSARAIVTPGVLFPVFFAVFITLKLVNYTLIELPFFAIAIAWGASWLWTRALMLTRPLLAAIAVALVIEGGQALTRLDQASSPYPAFAAQIRQYLPSGARVLGLHTYWFGLEDFDYRSFLVPLNLADEGLPLDQGLTQVGPDVVLLDARMRAYFDEPSVAADRDRFHSWMAQHDARVLGRIDDPTYGLLEIYRVSR